MMMFVHDVAYLLSLVQENLHHLICESAFFKKQDYARACVEGFILTDRLISQKVEESSGSTATMVLLDGKSLYCVNSYFLIEVRHLI